MSTTSHGFDPERLFRTERADAVVQCDLDEEVGVQAKGFSEVKIRARPQLRGGRQPACDLPSADARRTPRP